MQRKAVVVGRGVVVVVGFGHRGSVEKRSQTGGQRGSRESAVQTKAVVVGISVVVGRVNGTGGWG